MENKFIGIIPARYGSSRFPGKPLAMLGGKTVIEHVCTQAKKALDEVYVATDDERIAKAVEAFGGKAIMTRPDHACGTDRIEEALDIIMGTKAHQEDIVVINIQGDEPFIRPEQIEAIKRCFDAPCDIATLVKPFTEADGLEALKNPNSPKVVFNDRMEAILFSRSVIPYLRGIKEEEWLSKGMHYKHIGMYAYRAHVLHEITRLPQSPLEKAESLEQLRWLEAGYRIRVGLTDTQTIGIDTPEDLQKAEQFLQGL